MTSGTATDKAGGGNASAGWAARLLAWYDRHHRDLPWRVPPAALARGERPDPYRVWLSEVMLQQTTVQAVRAYYVDFLARWPTVGDLAAAPAEDVMKAWAGLGYYSRARNLKAAAEAVAALPGQQFPDTVEGLRALPGIGAYTAAAVAAIAFDRPAAVVDGNVERVVTRLEVIDVPLPAAKPLITALVAAEVPAARPGDFAQAMMDLGATLCTPRRPACAICPIREDCAAVRRGDPERYPVKAAKAEKPVRFGDAFVALRADGAVLLRTRPAKGLLGGMAEVPSSGWDRKAGATERPAFAPPFAADWRKAGDITHTFTHFTLRLTIYRAVVDVAAPEGFWWSEAAALSSEALPTVMRKAIEAAIEGPLNGARDSRGSA